ncbi:MAG TPA: PEP-CTERM sorting domain-containing protein, partial [Phycisphaerae bacterium]|nr:PEP-CTERM sorting domain-containing protein [Phycisphaerae bacterium]
NTTDFYDVYTASGTGVTNWDDATATWNSNQPTWTYTLAENDEVNITAAGWYHWDITTSLSRTDVVTFGLLSKVETSDTNQRAFFYSTHGGTSTQVQPYLEVTYEAVPEPTTAMLLLGIGCVRVFCKNGF